tara:strand:- start:721 stop:1050 length:330 start_codon:yes stop_codon:yes gene_type:complete
MAGKGIHTYTVQESQNASLGQAGSIYLNTADNFTPSKGVIVAIHIVTDNSAFGLLTAEDNTKYMSYAGTGYEAGGVAISTQAFPIGTILFGRWTSITLAASSSVFCYIG